MCHSLLYSFRTRLMLTALLSGVMLITGLFGFGGQSPSWAAPAQNPHLQTVPTRPPDDDDPPPPPESAPPAEGSVPAPGDDKDSNTPTQPPEPTNNGNPNQPQLPQPAPQTDSGGQEKGVQGAQPAAIPTPKSDQNKGQASSALTAPGQGNNDNISRFVPQADLSLSQMVNNPTPQLGEVVTLTIAISNNGPNSATNVVVSEALPPGLFLSSATPGRGWYNNKLGLWAVGIITPSQSITLSLVATVANVGPITNTIEITAAHPADPDSIPGNGFVDEDDWASLAIAALPATAQSPQSDGDSLQLADAVQTGSVLPFQQIGSLSWLYALGLGLILILSGIYLVNRA